MNLFFYLIDSENDANRVSALVNSPWLKVPAATIEGVWIDECSDASMMRRRGGTDLLWRVRRGDHVVVPYVRTLGGPLRGFQSVLDHLVYTRGLTLHFVAEDLTFAAGADTARMNELAEQAFGDWRVRRTREGVARWKAYGGRMTGWAPYGVRIVLRNGKRTTVGCWWERRWIERIVEWRKAGLTYPQIVSELRRRKAQTSRGTAWNCDRVRRVVAWQDAEKSSLVGTSASSGTSSIDAEQRLCLPTTNLKPGRKPTSVEPHTFEVDGIPVKWFPKPRQAGTELSRDYRAVMRTMRMICRAIS